MVVLVVMVMEVRVCEHAGIPLLLEVVSKQNADANRKVLMC